VQLATARGWVDVRDNCLRFIQASFSGLLKLLGTEQLRDAMSHDTFDEMYQYASTPLHARLLCN